MLEGEDDQEQEETIIFYWFSVKILRGSKMIITEYKEFPLKILNFLLDLKQKKATKRQK